MIFALLPVKAPGEAKERLAAVLSRREREELARAMFGRVLPILLAARGLDRVVVASSDTETLRRAAAAGALTLAESAQQSHSASADWGARKCMELGATTLLLVPIDAPLLAVEEIEALVAQARSGPAGPRLIIVPSLDGTGTNAMVRTPPDLIESCFGPNSFEAHVARANARGAKVEVARPHGLVFDLDTPEDVERFLSTEQGGPVADYLRAIRAATVRERTERTPSREIRIVPLRTLPEISPGDDLARLIFEAAQREGHALENGCAVVVAQKVVSKTEGRIVDLREVQSSPAAETFARQHDKDPRLIELILRQARRIVKMERGVIIVETHQGWVCANAGVDVSNVPGDSLATLLPCDADASAEALRQKLRELSGADCAVVVSDTFGRPWREGLANVAIGAAGFEPLVDYRGRRDRHGRVLRGTIIAVADELAAAAGLAMEKAAGTPVVLVYGAGLERGEGRAQQLIRPPERDLFR